jgi:hypothetical protein
MGDLFRPKQQTVQPSATERLAGQAAERERLEAVRDLAERRTAQLMRLFGTGQAFGARSF